MDAPVRINNSGSNESSAFSGEGYNLSRASAAQVENNRQRDQEFRQQGGIEGLSDVENLI